MLPVIGAGQFGWGGRQRRGPTSEHDARGPRRVAGFRPQAGCGRLGRGSWSGQAAAGRQSSNANPQNGQRKPSLDWTSCPSSSSRAQDPQRAPMLIGFPSLVSLRRLSAVRVDVLAGWWLAVSWAPVGGGRCGRVPPVSQHLQAGGEPLVPVVDPDADMAQPRGGLLAQRPHQPARPRHPAVGQPARRTNPGPADPAAPAARPQPPAETSTSRLTTQPFQSLRPGPARSAIGQ
jgi:hypothetical protein